MAYLSKTFLDGENDSIVSQSLKMSTLRVHKDNPFESNLLTSEKKVQNNSDGQHHLLKVAGPHQLDKRRQKQQEPVEKMFPHIAATHHLIRNAISGVGVGTMQQKLMKAIKFYISGCSKEYEEILNCSTQKCRRLARSMTRTMDLLREICSTFDDSVEYFHRMSELVAIYISCELRSANELKETKPLISNRICQTMYKHLKSRSDEDTKSNILRVFVNMPKMHNEREVMTKIFQYFIPKEQVILQRELPDREYIQYLIVFYHWKKLEFDVEEQLRVIEFANKFMRPAKTLCRNPIYAKHLPEYSTRQKATMFILQNLKYFQDLRNASIYDNRLNSQFGVIDLSDDDETIETSEVSIDFGSIVKNAAIKTIAPVVKLEKQTVTAVIDLTVEDEKEKALEWLKILRMNANKMEPSHQALSVLACRSADKDKSAEIIEIESDSDLDLEEQEQIGNNYLDYEQNIAIDDELSNDTFAETDSEEESITFAKTDATRQSSNSNLTVQQNLMCSNLSSQTSNSQSNLHVDSGHTKPQKSQVNHKIVDQQQSETQFPLPRIVDTYSWRRNSIHISDRNTIVEEIATNDECISTNDCRTQSSNAFNSSNVIYSQSIARRLPDTGDQAVEDANYKKDETRTLKKQVKFNDNPIIHSRATYVQYPIKSAIKTSRANKDHQSTTIFSTPPLRFGCASPASSTSSYSETKQIAEKGMNINSFNKLKTNKECNEINISIISTQPTIDFENLIPKSSNSMAVNSNNIRNNDKNKNNRILNDVSSNSSKIVSIEKTDDVTQAADISSTNCHVNVDNSSKVLKESVQVNIVESVENHINVLEDLKNSENLEQNNIISTNISQDVETNNVIMKKIKENSVLENASKINATHVGQSKKALSDLSERIQPSNVIVDDNEESQLCCVSTSTIEEENMSTENNKIGKEITGCDSIREIAIDVAIEKSSNDMSQNIRQEVENAKQIINNYGELENGLKIKTKSIMALEEKVNSNSTEGETSVNRAKNDEEYQLCCVSTSSIEEIGAIKDTVTETENTELISIAGPSSLSKGKFDGKSTKTFDTGVEKRLNNIEEENDKDTETIIMQEIACHLKNKSETNFEQSTRIQNVATDHEKCANFEESNEHELCCVSTSSIKEKCLPPKDSITENEVAGRNLEKDPQFNLKAKIENSVQISEKETESCEETGSDLVNEPETNFGQSTQIQHTFHEKCASFEENNENDMCCVSTSSIKEEGLPSKDSITETEVIDHNLEVDPQLNFIAKIANSARIPEKETESCEEVSTSCRSVDDLNDTENNSMQHLESQTEILHSKVSGLPDTNSESDEPKDNNLKDKKMEIETKNLSNKIEAKAYTGVEGSSAKFESQNADLDIKKAPVEGKDNFLELEEEEENAVAKVQTEFKPTNVKMQKTDSECLKPSHDEITSDIVLIDKMPENIMDQVPSFSSFGFEKFTEFEDTFCANLSNKNSASGTKSEKIFAEKKKNFHTENKMANIVQLTEGKDNALEAFSFASDQKESTNTDTFIKSNLENSCTKNSTQKQVEIEKNSTENDETNFSKPQEIISSSSIEVPDMILNDNTLIFNEIKNSDVVSCLKEKDKADEKYENTILLNQFDKSNSELLESSIKDFSSSFTFELEKKPSEIYFDISTNVDIESMCNLSTQVPDIDLSDNIDLHVGQETCRGTSMEELGEFNLELVNESVNVKNNDYEHVINHNPQIRNIVKKSMDIEKLEENIKTMRRELQLELEEWNENTKEFIIQQQSMECLEGDDPKNVEYKEPTDFYALEEFLILHKRRPSQENSKTVSMHNSERDNNAGYTPPYICVESPNISKKLVQNNVDTEVKEESKPSDTEVANEGERNECELDSDLEFDFDFVFGLDFDSVTSTNTQNISSAKESYVSENIKIDETDKLLVQTNATPDNTSEAEHKTNKNRAHVKKVLSENCESICPSSSSTSSTCTCSTCPPASKRRLSSSSSSSSSSSQVTISSTINQINIQNRNENVVLGPLELDNELLLNEDDLLPSSELIANTELLQELVTIPSMGTKSIKSLTKKASSKRSPIPPISVECVGHNEDIQPSDYEITWHSKKFNSKSDVKDRILNDNVKPSLLVSIPTKNLKNLKTFNLSPSDVGQENKKYTQNLSEILETSAESSVLTLAEQTKALNIEIDRQETSETIKGIIFRVTAPKRRISDFSIMQLIGFSEEQTVLENLNDISKNETQKTFSLSSEIAAAETSKVGAPTAAGSSSVNNEQYECEGMPISRRVLIRDMNSNSPFIDQQQLEIALPLKKRRKLSEFHDESSANSSAATLTEEEDTDTDDNLIVLESSNGARTATHLRRSVKNMVAKANLSSGNASDDSQTVYIVVQSVTVKSPERLQEVEDFDKAKLNSRNSNDHQIQNDLLMPTTSKNSLYSLNKEHDINASNVVTLNPPSAQTKPILLPTNSSPPQNKQIQVVTPQIKELPKIIDMGNTSITSIPESYPAEPMLSIANFENLVHLQKYLDSLIASKHLAKTIDVAMAVTNIFKDFHDQEKRQNLIAMINNITKSANLDTEKLMLRIQMDGSISILVDNNNVNEWVKLPPATASLLTKAATTLAKLENYKKQFDFQSNLFVQPQEPGAATCNNGLSIMETGNNLVQTRANNFTHNILPVQGNLQLPKKETILVELQMAEIRIQQEQNKRKMLLTNLKEIQTGSVSPLEYNSTELSREIKSTQEDNFCATPSSSNILQQPNIISTQQSNEQHFAELNFPCDFYAKKDKQVTEKLIDHHTAKVVKAQSNLTFCQANEKHDYVSSKDNQTIIEKVNTVNPFYAESSNFSELQTFQNSTEHASEQQTTAPTRDLDFNSSMNNTIKKDSNQFSKNPILCNQTAVLNEINEEENKIDILKNFLHQKTNAHLKSSNINNSNVSLGLQPHCSSQIQDLNKISSIPILLQTFQLPTFSSSSVKSANVNDELLNTTASNDFYAKSDEHKPFYSAPQSHSSNVFNTEAITHSQESSEKNIEHYSVEQHILMLEKQKQFEQMMKQREVIQQQKDLEEQLQQQKNEVEELQRKQQRELEELEELERMRQKYESLQNQHRTCEEQILVEEEKFRKLQRENLMFQETKQHNTRAKHQAAMQEINTLKWLPKNQPQKKSFQQQMEDFVRLQYNSSLPNSSPTETASPITIPEEIATPAQPTIVQTKKRRGRQAKPPSLTLNLITNINNTTTIDLQNTLSKINMETPVPAVQNSVAQSDTTMPRKRGRPRKTPVMMTAKTTTTTTTTTHTQHVASTSGAISPTIPNISFSNMLFPPPIIPTKTGVKTSPRAKYNAYSIHTPATNFGSAEISPILTNIASNETPLPCKRRRIKKTFTSSPKKV